MRYVLLYRALRGRRGRALLAGAGVGSSALLVIVMLAAYRSLTSCVVAYAGQAGCDVWIAPRGTDNLIRSGGFLPAEWMERAKEAAGVDAVDPVLRTFVSVEAAHPAAPGAPLTVLAIGHRGLGGPPAFATGGAAREPDEITLDRAAAFRLGVSAGDAVTLNGDARRVVGLTRGTNLIATQFLFADYADTQDALGVPGRASFLVARLVPGADAGVVARDLAVRLPDSLVMTSAAFVAHNQREVAAGFLPLLALLAGLGLGVAATLVALLVQGLVEDRRADIAVLLALGAGTRAVSSAVLAGAALVILAGTTAGAALSHLLGLLLDRLLPTIELTYRPTDTALVFALFAAAGLVASWLPVARLQRIDPLEAFRP